MMAADGIFGVTLGISPDLPFRAAERLKPTPRLAQRWGMTPQKDGSFA